jgi:hypothetical protein
LWAGSLEGKDLASFSFFTLPFLPLTSHFYPLSLSLLFCIPSLHPTQDSFLLSPRHLLDHPSLPPRIPYLLHLTCIQNKTTSSQPYFLAVSVLKQVKKQGRPSVLIPNLHPPNTLWF